MNGCLLAFDTSTEALAVAVQTPRQLSTWNGEGGAAASAQLLPRIRRMLQEADIELKQLQAIAFGAGPGAFTGLRTACAVAQGLAFGASLPVRPLDSLLIVAEGVARQGAIEVDVVMDARMGEVYAGRYHWTGARWLPRRAPVLSTLDALHGVWQSAPPQWVAGSALQVFGERLRCGDARRVEVDADRAAALMRLAQQAWRDHGGIDAAEALPLYLRDKVALTVAEREALRAPRGGP